MLKPNTSPQLGTILAPDSAKIDSGAVSQWDWPSSHCCFPYLLSTGLDPKGSSFRVNTPLAKLCLLNSVCIPGNTEDSSHSPPFRSYFRYTHAFLQWWFMSHQQNSLWPNQHIQEHYESTRTFHLKLLLSPLFKIFTQSSSFMASCCSERPRGGLVQMVPCHRISVIDQGSNCLEFAAKYSKKCCIYHLPTPKWYCSSKSISFSTPWFSGFLWFMKYFLPRAHWKHLYKIEFIFEQVTFLLNFNSSKKEKGRISDPDILWTSI